MTYQTGERTTAENFVIRWTIFKGLGSDDLKGGAISAVSVPNLVVRYCLFEDDISFVGGGIYAQYSAVNIFSTCFLSCRGSDTKSNEGGNAVTFSHSPLFLELSSACKCAPNTEPCGDGIYNGVSAPIWALNLNTSYCKGIQGECSIGIIEKTDSTVKYLNSMSCTQYDLICLPEGKIYDSNFIDNEVTYLFYGMYAPNYLITKLLSSVAFLEIQKMQMIIVLITIQTAPVMLVGQVLKNLKIPN